jgi:hypothetical protein
MSSSVTNSVSLTNGTLYIQGNPTQGCNLTAYLEDNGTKIDASADNGHAITVSLSSVKAISITGGTGNDYIFVDDGIVLPVTINGGGGNDTIRGGGGKNTISEPNGSSWISGRGTSDVVTVGAGNNTILGASGPATITAGSGNDSIVGGGGNDSITAGNGNDTIWGDSGNDTITGGNGNDLVYTGKGTNKVTLGTGTDIVTPGTGTNNIILGSSKSKVLSSSGKNTVTIAGSSSTTGSTATSTTSTSSGSTGSTGSTSTSPAHSTQSIGSDSWVTYAGPKPTGTEPQAIMQVLSAAPMVGIAIDTRALESTLGVGTPIDADYQWNFGDTGSQFNTLPGFNASHIYQNPGTYTISLTVTNNAGQSSSVSMNIKIAADTRRVIYVNAASGNDYNNGSSPGSAVATAARALQLVGNDTEVLFACGQTFNLAQAFKLDFNNVLVSSYGSGAQPVINYTATGLGQVIFTTNSTAASGVTVENLTLTTLDGKDPTVANQPMGFMAGGYDVAVEGCTFDYVEYDVNASAGPQGLTVQDNRSPIDGGLEGYFVWDQGTDTTVMGNYVNSSVHEHVMRTSSATQILVYQNDFNNFDGKGCIEIHVGADAWIEANTVDGGDIRTGPLGLWGEPVDATTDCVINGNYVDNSDITVYPGAQHIMIENNVITRSQKQLIDVMGQDGLGRQSEDIRIYNNTGFLTSTEGNFVKIENYTQGVTLENNLLVQPQLDVGGYDTAPVYVALSNLDSFTYISNNVWQEPRVFDSYAHGGIDYVGADSAINGYLTAAAWNAEPQVGTDYFTDTPINMTNYTPDAGSLATYVGVPVPGVFTNLDGTPRSRTGSWSAGAV